MSIPQIRFDERTEETLGVLAEGGELSLGSIDDAIRVMVERLNDEALSDQQFRLLLNMIGDTVVIYAQITCAWQKAQVAALN